MNLNTESHEVADGLATGLGSGDNKWLTGTRSLKVAPDHSTSRRVKQRSLLTIEQRFEVFHRENPHIFELLVVLAMEAKGAGHRNLGISLLWERLRWELMMETQHGSGYKLCNDYRSRYARKIMLEVPELRGFFRIRGLETP